MFALILLLDRCVEILKKDSCDFMLFMMLLHNNERVYFLFYLNKLCSEVLNVM